MTARLTPAEIDALGEMWGSALGAAMNPDSAEPGQLHHAVSFMLTSVPALIAAARNEAVLREALEGWHAPFEGRPVESIARHWGTTTAARVRMTRKALGIES